MYIFLCFISFTLELWIPWTNFKKYTDLNNNKLIMFYLQKERIQINQLIYGCFLWMKEILFFIKIVMLGQELWCNGLSCSVVSHTGVWFWVLTALLPFGVTANASWEAAGDSSSTWYPTTRKDTFSLAESWLLWAFKEWTIGQISLSLSLSSCTCMCVTLPFK